MNLQAVLFDLDDTLVVDEAATRKAFEAAAREALQFGAEEKRFLHDSVALARSLWQAGPFHDYCERIGINDAECIWGSFGQQTPELRGLATWAQDYRINVFDRALRQQMIENQEAAQRLCDVFISTRRREGRLLPDALATLAALRSKLALGLVTNGAPDIQMEKVRQAGLENLFQAICVSGYFPAGKPHPEIFHEALRRLGARPDAAAMVGNSLARDIAGARNAGLAVAVLLRVPGAEEPADCLPDITINSLGELPQALSEWSAASAHRIGSD